MLLFPRWRCGVRLLCLFLEKGLPDDQLDPEARQLGVWTIESRELRSEYRMAILVTATRWPSIKASPGLHVQPVHLHCIK